MSDNQAYMLNRRDEEIRALAAEAEQLRAERDMYRDRADSATKRNAQLIQENERLRRPTTCYCAGCVERDTRISELESDLSRVICAATDAGREYIVEGSRGVLEWGTGNDSAAPNSEQGDGE